MVQHIRCEPPGIFADLLRARGIGIDAVEIDEGDELPDWRDVDLVVAMGEPMGAYDEADHPWLTGEKQWIAQQFELGSRISGCVSAPSCLPRASAGKSALVLRLRSACFR